MLPQILLNGIIAGCECGLVAAGLALVYQLRGFFHVAHGAIYVSSAYVANILIVDQGSGVAAAVAVAILAGVAIGLAMEVCVYRPLVHRGASPTILMIASLGLLLAIQNIVAFTFGSFVRSFYVRGVDESFIILDLHVTTPQVVVVVAYLLLGLMLWLWMFRTRSGKHVRAVADNPSLSTAFGIRSDSVVLVVFAVASALGAVAGILAGYNTNVFPSMGFWGILPGIVAAVIGGLGSIVGAFLGGMVVGVVRNLTAWILPTMWQDAIMFAILLGFLLVRPRGILAIALPGARS